MCWQDQAEFPGAGISYIQTTACAGQECCDGLDEWDYWVEGSFNLGIYMWIICSPSGGPSEHVTQPGISQM